jgi:hypothetical protein
MPLALSLLSCSPAQPPGFQGPDSPPLGGPRPTRSTPQATQTGKGKAGGTPEMWGFAKPLGSLDDLNSCAASLPPIGSYSQELQPGVLLGPVGERRFRHVRDSNGTGSRVRVEWVKYVVGNGSEGLAPMTVQNYMNPEGDTHVWESSGIIYEARTNTADGGVTITFTRRCPSPANVAPV